MGVPLAPSWIQPFFAFSAVLFKFEVVIYHKEIAEMIMGMAFSLLTGGLFLEALRNIRKIFVKETYFATGALLSVLTMTGLFMTFGPSNIFHQRYAFHVMAVDDYPERGMYAQAIKVFNQRIPRELAPGLPLEGRVRETIGFSNTEYHRSTDSSAANVLEGKPNGLFEPGYNRNRIPRSLLRGAFIPLCLKKFPHHNRRKLRHGL